MKAKKNLLRVLLLLLLFAVLPGCRLAKAVLPFFLMDQQAPSQERSREYDGLSPVLREQPALRAQRAPGERSG